MLLKEVILKLLLREVNKIPSLQQQLLEIEKKIQSKIKSAMQNELSQQSKTTIQMHVVTDVYNVYEPTSYSRSYDQGGLLDRDNIETKMIDNNTLKVKNIRKDELDGRMVDKVIEYGKGYWTQTLDDIIGARPFIHNSFIDLKNGKARDALKRGLIREGLNIK